MANFSSVYAVCHEAQEFSEDALTDWEKEDIKCHPAFTQKDTLKDQHFAYCPEG